jgi:hypothetical protein
VVWQCFRASCKWKGAYREGFTLDDALSFSEEKTQENFRVPERFVPATASLATINLLRNNGSLLAYTEGRADVRYDPEQNRAVFVIKDSHGNELAATGRSLTSGIGADSSAPKWFRYDRSYAFHLVRAAACGSGVRKCVLVEDSLSACAVSRCVDGIALLGVKLPATLPAFLSKNYDLAVLALDPDYAGLKNNSDLHRKLSPYITTKILVLQDEFKTRTRQETADILARVRLDV